MIRAVQARDARKRFREMAPVLNEQSLRRFVAMEARALGRGGVSLMSRISGLARSTIYHGLADIRDHLSAPSGRIRKPGGGRKKKSSEDPTLVADLMRLVEPTTRGDPMQPLLWTTRSLRNLVNGLAAKGHKVSPTVVSDLLRDMGYSLQANSKTREGTQHIDRDAQFRYINTQAMAFLAANEPLISVDTKKKELVGNFKNNGREWRRQGTPELVNVHDFIDPKLKRAVPYGSTTSPTTLDGSASAPIMTPPPLPSMRSAAGGGRWERSVTRTPSASWLRLTVVAATDIVSVCGKLSFKSWLTSSSCPSRSVTCRQAPRSGTR